MIPYAELERAIARWKARQDGLEAQAVPEAVSSPSETGEVYAEASIEVDEAYAEVSSGIIELERDEK